MHGCDPERVSDGSWLVLYQTLSIECPSSIFFRHVHFVILVSFSSSFSFVFFLCSHWSFVDLPLIFFWPADHVPDWQPRILLGMVEARSVNVKKTITTTVYTSPLSVLADASVARTYILCTVVQYCCLHVFIYQVCFLFGDMHIIRARFTAAYAFMCKYSGMYAELCIYVWSSHIARVRINRVRLPMLLVVSWLNRET